MGNTPDKSDNNSTPADTRLDDLGARINAKRQATSRADKQQKTSGSAGVAQAMRLSSEFIAGVCVGAGVGWMIDKFFGTSPWGLIILLLLGFGAGVLNALRSAGLVAETNMHLGASQSEKDLK